MSSLIKSKTLSLREVQRQTRAWTLTKSPRRLQHGWFGVGTSSPRFTFAKPFNKSTHASNLRVFFGHDDDDDEVADDDGIEVAIISSVKNSARAFDAEAISNDTSLNLKLKNIYEYYDCAYRDVMKIMVKSVGFL
ncbi:uncharacterized protein LOC127902325 [Citrus sinensis]|uniref:uncharacterized protein LOC127902325 n=1 Tax=Citrus sinensis TaxID=2711 RepID=UPI002278141A|nr:uncharacterized protein LOC127902325 [Citrus sinensis]